MRQAEDGLEVDTFGCRQNAYESDQALARARADGLTNAVIFNTCAVTAEAVRQAKQAIRKARRARPDARLIVTGCAAQIDPDLFDAMTEVDAVLGNGLKSQPGAYGQDSLSQRVRINDVQSLTETAPYLDAAAPDRARAYVEVQNGCDHRCTFCIIPYGRGASRSAPAGEVVAAVARLVEKGVKEVVLTGVDLTSWGEDLPGRPSLGQLVGRILRLAPDLPRLRLSSIDAAEIDEDLLRLFAESERLAPHLHLSLQSGDDMILKRMKRRHSRNDALRLIARVRAVRPDVAFGADLIAGFPTETEAMFEASRTLIAEAGLSFVHVFPFSPRPGAPAARMPQLSAQTIKQRAEVLRQAATEALARHLAARLGRVETALVERPGLARAADFTEISFAPGGEAAGDMISLRAEGHDEKRLLAVRTAA